MLVFAGCSENFFFMYLINSHLCSWKKVSANCSVRWALPYYTSIVHAQENVKGMGANNYVVIQGFSVTLVERNKHALLLGYQGLTKIKSSANTSQFHVSLWSYRV